MLNFTTLHWPVKDEYFWMPTSLFALAVLSFFCIIQYSEAVTLELWVHALNLEACFSQENSGSTLNYPEIKLGLRILCKYIKGTVFDLGSKTKRLSDCGVHVEICHILQTLFFA